MNAGKKNTIFNPKDNAHITKQAPLFLGMRQGLYDSINVAYPRLFEIYKEQLECMWTEDEYQLEQSRMDMISPQARPEEIDIMVKTLALLWELDSVASRAVYPLFAPFITNSELGTLMSMWTSFENIHALTYSEIIRQCVPDTESVFNEIYKNDEVLGRAETVIKVFDDLSEAGSKYNLGLIQDGPELKKIIIKSIIALYLLERVQFMSSFAVIFGMAELGRYTGIASFVTLICRDELIHANASYNIIKILREDDDWNDVYVESLPELKELFDGVIDRELKWNEYIFSEGRNIVGLNTKLLDDWVYYCADDLAKRTDIPNDHPTPDKVPISWVENWIDMDKVQAAPQEVTLVNYRKNAVKNDLSDDEVFDI